MNQPVVAFSELLQEAAVESLKIMAHHGKSLHVEIDHVTGWVVMKLNVMGQVRCQLHLIDVIFGFEERRCQIKQAVSAENLHLWVLAQGRCKVHCYIRHCLAIPESASTDRMMMPVPGSDSI